MENLILYKKEVVMVGKNKISTIYYQERTLIQF